MGRHKSAPGRIYEIKYKNSNEAYVNYTYFCPYCDRETTVQKFYSQGLDVLERGGFYEPLRCGHCDKITDVRFYSNNRKM